MLESAKMTPTSVLPETNTSFAAVRYAVRLDSGSAVPRRYMIKNFVF